MLLRKNLVTGSRLPALLGIYGKQKFELYWRVVLEGKEEKELLQGNFLNFKRGQMYEKEALDFFCKSSSCYAKQCGFFINPDDPSYGASPDGLVAPGLLIEIKTRAVNSAGPLECLHKNKCANCFIQCQLEMICTNSQFCILMSYHPESKSANYFMIKRDNLLWSVIKDVTDSILKKEPIIHWTHKENALFEKLEGNVFLRIPDFDSLKPLRTYINQQLSSVKRVTFV